MRSRALLSFLLLIGSVQVASSQTPLRKIGELDLPIQGISATVHPANPTIPKNTPAGVQIVVTTASGTLTSADLANFLGGAITVTGELSGPGLPGAISLPVAAGSGGTPIVDPLILAIPALSEAGDYTLTNLKILVNGNPSLDVTPSTVPVKVIDQVLITSVLTRPLTLDEIKAAGIVLSSNDFLGFQFTIGLATSSNATTISFPAVFDRNGVPIPQPLAPPLPPTRDSVPIPTIRPVLLNLCASPLSCVPGSEGGGFKLPDGTPVQPQIPGVLVIPGDVGFLKQFFSAQLFVANGSPGGSGLVVHDVTGKINLPPSPSTSPADAPLSLPDLKGATQPDTKPVLGVGPDGANDVNKLNPGDQGEAEFIIRGDHEGFSPISFDIQGTLDGLATGPITVKGTATGGVLVRNPFFDMTFAVPGVVRSGETFKVFVTVKNISQSTANLVHVTIDSSRLSGATLLSDPTQNIPTIAGGAAKTLSYSFKSLTTGQVVATYLHFDTNDGTTGELKFTLGVGERGIPLSPDTLVLPASVDNLPESVVDAAMLVLGEGWSIANAPAGTLPANVIRTSKAVVTQKALALAEAGLRIKLNQPPKDALRDLLDDFYGGNPIDPGFDQLLRTTDAGQNFERAVGAALAQPVAGDGVLPFQQDWSNVLASGPDFISFALTNGSAPPPVAFSFTDGDGNVSQSLTSTGHFSNDVPGFAQIPLGSDTSPSLGLMTSPGAFPYTLQLTGTDSGTFDLAVTMPHADGRFIAGQISGVQVSPGLKGRVVLNLSQPDRMVLELDTGNDGTFATQKPLTTTIIAAQGPKLLSANVIGPETLPNATPLGVQMALLFDRVVDSNAAQLTTNYQIPQNAVQQSKAQLSGRIVVANLQQPEGTYVPTTVSVNGMPDGRGAVGPSAINMPLGSQIQDPGAVVSGRVFNADGTPVSTAVVTYSQFPPDSCGVDAQPVGVSAIPVTNDGRYQVRYVRQDDCGRAFSMSTQDPNTGGLRQLSSFVRFAGERLVMDIALFGRGTVAGTVRDTTGAPVPGATVVVLSVTDNQIGAQTRTDGNGQYSVSGITVGPVTVQAGSGNRLGHSTGNIGRAGNTAIVDVTLDSGAISVSGTLLEKINGGTATPVPNWPVGYVLGPATGAASALAVVKTDSGGNFTFTAVPEGNFTVFAQLTVRDFGSASNFAVAGTAVTGVDITVNIDNRNFGTVNGLVFNADNTPAPGVLVVGPGSTGVATDSGGAYSLPGVPLSAAPQVITAQTADELQSASAKVIVSQPGQVVNNVNITLPGLGTAQFKVLDGNGQPVVGQVVNLMNGCSAVCGCSPVKVTTNSDGSVTLAAAPVSTDSNGVATFTNMPVGALGGKAVSATFDVADGTAVIPGNKQVGFAILRFAGSGTVTGSVLDPDGRPSFGANIALTANVFDPETCTLGPGLAQQLQTDPTGTFKFNRVKVGRVGVTASQVFSPTRVGKQGTLLNGATVNFDLQLVNTTAGEFSGTVFLPDGVTPAGAGVEVTASGPLPDVTVSTGANSQFHFAKIFPQGSYTVTVRDPITGGVARDTVFLPAGQPPNPAPDVTHDFRLKGKGTVTVQVVDGSNQPVNTATVQLTENTFPNGVHEDEIQPANLGTVAFPEVFEGPFSVAVTDNVGRGGRGSSVLPGPGATVNVVVQLTSIGTVQGQFLMPDNTPIPFGNVTLSANGRQIGQITTDTTGSFSFSFVPAGPVLLQAQDPVTARTGVASGTILKNGDTLTLNVVAEGLGTVQGFVTSNGVNQPGANVDIFSGSYHAATSSDSTGHYIVSGVPVGHIVVNAAFQNNFLMGTNSATLPADGAQVEIDVALRGSGSIHGHVFQSDGQTLAPASVVTASVGGQGGGTSSVSTDASGAFTFSIVPEGLATLTATLLDSIDRGQLTVDVNAGANLNDVKLVLNGVGSISGHTQDSLGNNIAGHLTITGTGTFPYTFVLDTNSTGAFSVPQVLAGNFTASLSVASGSITTSGTTFSSVAPNTNTDVNVQLQPTGSVIGQVFRSDTATPATGANVTVSIGSGRSVVVQAQTDGSFTATGIPLGSFTVSINDPVSTGQALIQGQSITAAGQTVDLGKINLNDTPMAALSIVPADGTSGVVASSTAIVVTFSNPLSSTTGIQIVSAKQGNLHLPFTLSPDGKVANFTGLPSSDQITVTATTDVTDTLGRHPVQPLTSTFFVGPPDVVSITPATNKNQIATGAAITVNFREPLAASTNLTNLIALSNSSGAVSGTTALTTPTQAIFTPAAALPTDTVFTVTVNGATDLGGNVQTVPFTSTFATVDTIPPVVQLANPVNGGFVNTARPTISFSATDNLTGVDFTTGSVNLDNQVVATGTLSFTPSSNLSEGLHNVAATVRDRAGNVGTATGSFTVDTQPPTAATISGVTAGQVLKGTVPLSFSASDATSGVASIQLFVDGNPNVTVAPPFTLNFNTATLSEGVHSLSALAVDAAGNRGAMGPALSVEIDNFQVTVSITSPQPGADFRNSVTVTAVASEPVQNIQFALGQQSVTVSAAPYSATFDLTALPDSQQTITATATGFGDAPATATVAIHVKHNPPPPPDPAKILAQMGVNFVQITGFPGAVSGAVSVQITNPANLATTSVTPQGNGSFIATLAGSLGDTLAFTATDDVGNVSSVTNVTVASSNNSAAEPPRPLGSVVDSANPLAPNLVGLYLMNEGTGTTDINLVDSQPASFAGISTQPAWNVFDPSVVFAGGFDTYSYLNAGTDLIFDQLTPGAMTVVSKIFVTSFAQGVGIAEKNDGSNTGSGFGFGLDSGGAMHFLVARAGSPTIARTATAISTGQWVQVAASWDGTVGTASAVHLYVNGVEQTKTFAQDGGGTINFSGATNKPLQIGTSGLDMSASLNGKMAYLAIYKGRVLSPGELSELDQQLPIKQPNLPLVVSITSPPQGLAVNSQVTVSAAVDKEVQRVDFTLGSQTISATVPPYKATFDLTSVAEGAQTITATAVGFDSTTASATLNILVDHTKPPAPDPAKIFAEPPVGDISRVHGLAGAVTPSIVVEVTDLTDGLRELTTAAADGSFSVGIRSTAGDTVSVVAIDEAENRSPATTITVRAVASPFARLTVPGPGVMAAGFTPRLPMNPSSGWPLFTRNKFFSLSDLVEQKILSAAVRYRKPAFDSVLHKRGLWDR